jgi:hypothetical protein
MPVAWLMLLRGDENENDDDNEDEGEDKTYAWWNEVRVVGKKL